MGVGVVVGGGGVGAGGATTGAGEGGVGSLATSSGASAASTASTVGGADGSRGGRVVGSGVAMGSLGVAETEEAPDFFTSPARPNGSAESDLAAAFKTFALGNVPKGAIFATTPCRSMPASAKEGFGGAKAGSSQLSMNDLLFVVACAAIDFAVSERVLFGTAVKGLLYRERSERVGRGELISRIAAPSPACDCDREFEATMRSLAQGLNMRDNY